MRFAASSYSGHVEARETILGRVKISQIYISVFSGLLLQRNTVKGQNTLSEAKTAVCCLLILTYLLRNKYRKAIHNYNISCRQPGPVHIPKSLDISIPYAIGMGGLVQYIRHSLTAMGDACDTASLRGRTPNLCANPDLLKLTSA